MRTDLRKLVRRSLAESSEPDPHIVARRLALGIDKAMLDDAALFGLEIMVREEVRAARNLPTVNESRCQRTTSGPSRASVAMRERVCPDGDWRFLNDCTHSDLLALAKSHRLRSGVEMAKAREVEALAADLERSGCATVGEMRARARAKAAA